MRETSATADVERASNRSVNTKHGNTDLDYKRISSTRDNKPLKKMEKKNRKGYLNKVLTGQMALQVRHERSDVGVPGKNHVITAVAADSEKRRRRVNAALVQDSADEMKGGSPR